MNYTLQFGQTGYMTFSQKLDMTSFFILASLFSPITGRKAVVVYYILKPNKNL